MPFMWADTLLAAERAHLLRLGAWGAANLLVGTALYAWLRAGRRSSPLLAWFAIQTVAWGLAELAVAATEAAALGPRDLAGATRLDRLLWMSVGLDLGYVLAGITLVLLGWRFGRRLGAVGAGMAVVIQGGALLLLHLTLASRISR